MRPCSNGWKLEDTPSHEFTIAGTSSKRTLHPFELNMDEKFIHHGKHHSVEAEKRERLVANLPSHERRRLYGC
jgi:hypothetical protein